MEDGLSLPWPQPDKLGAFYTLYANLGAHIQLELALAARNDSWLHRHEYHNDDSNEYESGPGDKVNHQVRKF